MKNKTITVNGITAILEKMDETTTSCWLTAGRKSASLDCAMQGGEWSSDFSPVSDREMQTIEKIYDWAIQNGY